MKLIRNQSNLKWLLRQLRKNTVFVVGTPVLARSDKSVFLPVRVWLKKTYKRETELGKQYCLSPMISVKNFSFSKYVKNEISFIKFSRVVWRFRGKQNLP